VKANELPVHSLFVFCVIPKIEFSIPNSEKADHSVVAKLNTSGHRIE